MARPVNRSERERAIQSLAARTGAEALRKLWRKLQTEGPILSEPIRSGLELYVMEALMADGILWEPAVYLEVGMDLLEEAAHRQVEPEHAAG